MEPIFVLYAWWIVLEFKAKIVSFLKKKNLHE